MEIKMALYLPRDDARTAAGPAGHGWAGVLLPAILCPQPLSTAAV